MKVHLLPRIIYILFLITLFSCKKDSDPVKNDIIGALAEEKVKQSSSLGKELGELISGIPPEKQAAVVLNYLRNRHTSEILNAVSCVDPDGLDCFETQEQLIYPIRIYRSDPAFRTMPDRSRELAKTEGRVWEMVRQVYNMYRVESNELIQMNVKMHGPPPHTHTTTKVSNILHYNSTLVPTFPPNILTWHQTHWEVFPNSFPIEIPDGERRSFAILAEGEFHFPRVNLKRSAANYAGLEIFALLP